MGRARHVELALVITGLASTVDVILHCRRPFRRGGKSSPGGEPLLDRTIEAGDGLSANCLTQDLAHGIARQGGDLVDAA